MMQWSWSTLFRCGWVRIFGWGVSVKSPDCPALFSERNGYRKPFLRFRGWRFFWLRGGV